MKRRLFNLPFGPELELGPDLPIPRLVWRGLVALLTVLVLATVVAVIAAVLAHQQTGAEAWGPAPPDPVEPAVQIAGHPYRPRRGALYLTSVATMRVTALDQLIPGLLAREMPDANAEVVPLTRIYGPQVPTPQQETAQNREELAESEAASPIAAYRALGYRVSIVGGRPRLPYRTVINEPALGGGPSAGLMFALAIVNRFSDLTHGYRIAGTGTIDASGQVGPIGGARFKVVGAQRAGMQYFLVPAVWYPYTTWYGRYTSNFDEARACRCAGAMRLVPVRTLAEALSFLHHLH